VIFSCEIFYVTIVFLKYSMAESSSMKLLLGNHGLACKHDVIKVCSIEYLTTQIELVLPTFLQLLDRSQNYRIFNVRAIV